MKSKWKLICGACLLLIGIAACASTPQPFEYHDDREEKPGPGLFSGEAGGLIISNTPEARPPDAEKEPIVSP